MQPADLVALILAVVVAVVIVLTTVALLYLAVTGSDADMSQASDAISRFISVIIAALVGYMAGRRVNGH
jgi:hypothetical protein